MAKRRRYKTLDEHDAQLKAEGKWDAYITRVKQRDEEIERREQELARAEAALVNELHQVGFTVSSAWDFVNTSQPYPEALPVLARHLTRTYPDTVREGIARALAVRDAKFYLAAIG